MGAFLYYFPTGDEELRRETITPEFPFPEALRYPGRGVKIGPDGKRGYVSEIRPTVRATKRALAYSPDDQEWAPAENGAYWIGYDRADRPTPEDLQKKMNVTGKPVQLQDGNLWMVPCVHNRDGSIGPAINAIIQIDPSGRVIADRPAAQYARLWELVQALTRCASEEALVDFGTNKVMLLVSDSIGINYYVSAWELSILCVFTDENLSDVFKVLLDIPMLPQE